MTADTPTPDDERIGWCITHDSDEPLGLLDPRRAPIRMTADTPTPDKHRHRKT